MLETANPSGQESTAPPPEAMVDVFAPPDASGNRAKGKLPMSQLPDALRNGYEHAIRVTSDKGKAGWVPKSLAGAAITSGGFKLGPPEQQKYDQPPSTVGTIAREGALGVAGTVFPETEHPIRDLLTAPFHPSADPEVEKVVQAERGFMPAPIARVIGGMFQPNIEQAKKAKEAFHGANRSGEAEGIIRSVAAAVPIIGPAALNAGEQIGQGIQEKDVGKIAHGAGAGVGLTAQLAAGTKSGQTLTEKIVPAVAKPVIAAATKAPEALESAGRAIGNIVKPAAALEPVPAAIKSLKPRNSIPNIKETLASALPDARRAADSLGIEVTDLDSGQKAVTQAKKDLWSEYQSRLGPNAQETIDGNKIADAMEGTINKRFEEQNPQAAEAIRDKAAKYRRPMTLDEAEDYLSGPGGVNNELSSYYARNKISQRTAARDPYVGHMVAEGNALRDAIYSKLDDLTGPGAADIKKRYGALTTMEDILQRRINVADRAAPESLIEQMAQKDAWIARGKGAFKIITGRPLAGAADIVGAQQGLKAAKASRLANDSNELLKQAFSKTEPSQPAQPFVARPKPAVPTPEPEAGPAPETPPIANPAIDDRGIKAPQKRTFLRSSNQDIKEFYNYRFDQLRSEIKAAEESGDTNALADAQRRLAVLDQVQRAHPVEPEAVAPIARPGETNGARAVSAGPAVEAPRPELPKIDTSKKTKELAAAETINGNYGSDTQVKTASGSLPAKYKVVESDSLIPSHNAQTFAKNTQYPEGIQERAYHTSKEAQARVIQQSQNYDPAYTVNTNPDAVNGPPIVTKDGIVLGGNSRTMSTQRLYKAGGGDQYRDFLNKNAQQFGVSPEQIAGMKNPVLVREVETPGNVEQARRVGADPNRSMTGALGVSEKAVSAGRSVKPETLASISNMVNDLGEDATLRDAMRQHGKDIVSMLVKDGVLSDRERPQFVDTATGGLSDEGKTFVERALVGSVVDDPKLMDTVPKSVLGKLEGSLGDLATVGSRTDEYNLLPLVREALADHADMASRGLDVDSYLRQGGMFGPARNPAVDVITKALTRRPKEFRAALQQYAQDAKYDVQGQGMLGLGAKPSAAEAFNHALGANLSEEQFHDALLQSLEKESNIGGGGSNARQETGHPKTDEGVRGKPAPIARPGPQGRAAEAQGQPGTAQPQHPIARPRIPKRPS